MPASLEHKESVDALIADYIAAFRARNTMNEPPEITYSGGWFTFKSPRTYPRKYRRHAIEAMRDNLRRQSETEWPTNSSFA
jgi:hypothetical protein